MQLKPFFLEDKNKLFRCIFSRFLSSYILISVQIFSEPSANTHTSLENQQPSRRNPDQLILLEFFEIRYTNNNNRNTCENSGIRYLKTGLLFWKHVIIF